MDQQQPIVVGVRFSVVGKIYHFDARGVPDLRLGDHVVVETSRGWQLGQVAQFIADPPNPPDGEWKPVDRRATPRDLLLRQSWQNREYEVVSICKARSKELRLEGVKIVAAEYSFDGSRLAIMFSTETEEKADLKSLRSEMQKMYSPAQVEMRQIGPRDVAKILGGMGACGLENRCCSKFLTDFSSISIRMAKEQGISLTPSEITGMCGRLRCCLIYEYDQYVAARAELPKKNKRVITPQGEGKVIDVFPLKQTVLVDVPEVGYREYPKDDCKPAEEYEAFQKKAMEPCNHGEGCTCGKHGDPNAEGNGQPAQSGADQSTPQDAAPNQPAQPPAQAPASLEQRPENRPPRSEFRRNGPPREQQNRSNRGERNDRSDRTDRSDRPDRFDRPRSGGPQQGSRDRGDKPSQNGPQSQRRNPKGNPPFHRRDSGDGESNQS